MHKRWRSPVKQTVYASLRWVLAVGMIVLAMPIALSGCDQSQPLVSQAVNQENADEMVEELSQQKDEVNPPGSAKEYVGKNFQDVVSAFEASGFTMISAQEASEDERSANALPGEVLAITVGGDSTFTSDYFYTPDTEVSITYQPLDSSVSANPEAPAAATH